MTLTLKQFQSRGGKARAAKMTKAELVESGRKAALARWAKRSPHYPTPGAPAPQQKGSVS